MTPSLTPEVDWTRVVAARRGRVAAVALGGFTFVLLIAPQAIFPQLAPLHLALLAAGLAIFANAATRFTSGQRVLVLPRGTWPVLALGVWALIGVPLSTWPSGSLALFMDLYVKSLIILWLIPQVIDTPARLRRLIAWICLLGVVLAGTAISHYLSGTYETTAGNVPRIEGYDGPLTANPNDLALTLNMLLPLTWALLGVYRQRLVRAALLAVIVLEVAAVIVTFSRAAFITLGVVWIGHALRSLRGLKRLLVPLALVTTLGAIAIFPSGYAEHLSTSVNMEADTTGSAQARWSEALAATDAITAQPLVGHGLGMDLLAMNTRLEGNWHSVHNVFLQYAADLGLPGLVLFLILVVGCVRAARTVVRESRGDLARLAQGIELSLWAFLVEATFHPSGYHFYVFFFGGLALAARAIHQGVDA